MRSRVITKALGAILLGTVLISCSSTPSSKDSSPVPSSLTVEAATDWFGKASEFAHVCQSSSKAVGDAIASFAASGDSGETSIPILRAAGQAVEDCSGDEDATHQRQLMSEMDPVFPEATALLREWVAAMTVADRAALVAAATNLDSRSFVGQAFDDQRAADEIADRFEGLISQAAMQLGVDAPSGEILYHWNPPEH